MTARVDQPNVVMFASWKNSLTPETDHEVTHAWTGVAIARGRELITQKLGLC